MGLFAKLGLFKNKEQTTQQDIQKELYRLKKDERLHKRIKIADPTFASLTIGETCSLGIIDLSYGGIAALVPAALNLPKVSAPIACIQILDRSIAIRLALRRTVSLNATQALAAFAFLHENPDSLLFLRDAIEPSHIGESITLIAPTLRQERYHHPDWHCFRGEGPVDLLLRCEPDSVKPAEFLLTFRIQENYWDLGYRNGQLSTGRAAHSNSSAFELGVDTVIPSAELNPYVLRTAIFILLAWSTTQNALAQPIIALAKQALKSSAKIT